MQGPDLIFAMQDANFNFWNFGNGKPFLSSTPYFLNFAPSGWQEATIQNIRNNQYWGIDRSLTAPLKYVEDGACILKYIFYTLGLNQTVFLLIANQEINYDAPPAGTLSVVTGGNPLTTGANSGTITGTPGITVYVRLDIAGLPADYVTGSFNQTGSIASQVYPVLIPSSGVYTYNLVFNNITGATAQLYSSSAAGSLTGSYGYYHKRTFRSQIDFSTFNHNGSEVQVTCLEGGFPMYLKANEATIYTFALNSQEAVEVYMDGVNLHEQYNYNVLSGFEIDYSLYGEFWTVPVVFLNNLGDSVGIANSSQTIQNNSGLTWAQKLALLNILFQNFGSGSIPNFTDPPVQVTITGELEFVCTKMTSSPAYAVKFRFLTSDQLLPNQNDWQVMTTPSMVVGQTYRQYFSITVPVHVMATLQLEGVFFGGTGSEAGISFTANSNFSFSFVTRGEPSYIRGYQPQTLFEGLVYYVGQGKFKPSISPLFAQYSNIVFTSGNGLRSLDASDIQITWNDFFKFWNSFCSVGIQETNGVIYFDTKQNLIDTTNVIDLPEIGADSLKVSVDASFLFNEIDAGYDAASNNTGVLNGGNEFNDKMIFSTGAVISPAVLDLTSPIKAMCYEIEKIRITYVDISTGYPTDNDNFIVVTENRITEGLIANYYKLDRSLNTGASGLIESATVFNIAVSPKRFILNNGAYIRSALYLSDTMIFKFISSTFNSQMNAGGVYEGADINVGGLDAPFFQPLVFDLIVDPPTNLIDLLNLNPLQVYRFPWYGQTYVGILSIVATGPSSLASQAYKLMSVPENYLPNLIAYYGT